MIEYPRTGGGLDYHHNSPLIGEIPTNDYTHFHRSIDQLRSLNERGILNTNHFQNVLAPAVTSPAIINGVYHEIKLVDDKSLEYQTKVIRRTGDEQELLDSSYHTKKDNKYGTNGFRSSHSPPVAPQPQHIHYALSSTSPLHTAIQSNASAYSSNSATMHSSSTDGQMKSTKVGWLIHFFLLYFCAALLLVLSMMVLQFFFFSQFFSSPSVVI